MGHLVQHSCRSRVTYSRLHRTLSRRVLNISREGDSTTSLGSLFQCSITLRGKKFFLMFRQNFLWLSLCPLPLVLSLGTKDLWTPEVFLLFSRSKLAMDKTFLTAKTKYDFSLKLMDRVQPICRDVPVSLTLYGSHAH